MLAVTVAVPKRNDILLSQLTDECRMGGIIIRCGFKLTTYVYQFTLQSFRCISLTFALHSRGMYIRSEYCDSNSTS